MKLIIIIVIAFLVLLYVYTYIKYKKRKSQNINSVDEFHKKYLKESNVKKQNASKNTSYTKYITKYNSTLDYIEKDKFSNG